MKIKVFIVFLLPICFSCSVTYLSKHNYSLYGKVMITKVLFPVRTKISIYQNNVKIAETTSNKEGFFKVNVQNLNLKKEVMFIAEHNSYPDTIFNVNGHDIIRYSCSSNDTIFKRIENIDNCIELILTKCDGLISDENRVIEH